MRAVVVEQYGPPEVARVVEVPDPDAGRGEVVVRMHAAAVTSGDARIRGAHFPPGFGPVVRLALGVRKPRRPILGVCFSGVVDALGPDAAGLSVGDAVCGMTGTRLGAHAELVAVARKRVVRLPAGVTHDDAVGALFGGTTALYYLRAKAKVVAGESVLVIGASGAVGTNAVQLAKLFGARITGVTSAANAELVRQLGADRVIDHTTVDVTASTERFDVVLDAVGVLSIASGRRLLTPGGRLVLCVAGLGAQLRARGNVIAGSAPERPADFEYLLDLVATGRLTVVHDSAFPLERIADAYRRVDTGHKVGNVVVHP